MIILFHGDDTSASRLLFTTEKNKYPSATVLDGTKITKTDLLQLFEGASMFGAVEPVFIESLLSRKASKELEALTSYIDSQQKDNEIFIWEGKELTKKQLSSLPKAKVLISKLPQIIFTFLDSLKPNNSQSSILLYHQLLRNAEPEFVLFMLERQVRLMLALSSNAYELEEFARMSPWQKNKLSAQARLFSEKKLIKLYDQLYVLDRGYKTGQLNTPLSAAIDFLLLSL